MRVLLMADSFGTTGGGEVMVAYLARALRQRHEVAILSAGSGPSQMTTWEGLPVHHLHSAYHPRLRPMVSLLNPATRGGVREALHTFKPDVVHAWNVHHYLSYQALREAARVAPVIHTAQDAMAFCYTKFHCWIDPTSHERLGGLPRAHPEQCRNCRTSFWSFPIRNRLIQSVLRQAVHTPVSVSHALAHALVANGLPTPTVVHNGIPADDFAGRAPSVGHMEREWGLGDAPAVLAGGRLSHFKGHEQALRAFARTARSNNGQLLIMGSDTWYSQRLTERATELGVADRVKLLGLVPRETVPAVLARSRAVLNLSMYLDPFPTMNLEAMAAGRAVVGTCFGGTPEAVADGETGYVENPYDEERVASRIAALLSDDTLTERLGAAGYARFREHFQVEHMAAAYEALYEHAAAR